MNIFHFLVDMVSQFKNCLLLNHVNLPHKWSLRIKGFHQKNLLLLSLHQKNLSYLSTLQMQLGRVGSCAK